MPSGFGGEFAAWLGGSGFGRLGTGPGLWRAWGPLEAGAQTHTASGLDRQLALVKPSPSRGPNFLFSGQKHFHSRIYFHQFFQPKAKLLFPNFLENSVFFRFLIQ